MDWKAVLALGAVGLVVLYVFKKQAAAAASAVGAAINPISPQNIFYQGTSAVTGAVTGQANTSFGSEIYDWFNPAYNPNAPTAAQQPTSSTAQPFGITDTSTW